MSAFAPARVKSDPPSSSTQLLAEDVAFAAALREAGVASELDGAELARALRHVHSRSRAGRRIDLLEAYYAANADPLVSRRRQATDRWFAYAAGDALNASQLIQRLLSVVPELTGVCLERVGGGSSGTLVMRAGDHLCALEDEQAEDADLGSTVSVRGLVRAVNVLLDRQHVHARLVGLLGDGLREVYVAIASMTAALPLARANYLTAIDAELLMELTGW